MISVGAGAVSCGGVAGAVSGDWHRREEGSVNAEARGPGPTHHVKVQGSFCTSQYSSKEHRDATAQQGMISTFQCFCTHARNTCANTNLSGRRPRRLFRCPRKLLTRPSPPHDLLYAPAPSRMWRTRRQASDRYALIVYHKKSLLCNNLKIWEIPNSILKIWEINSRF